MSDNVKHPSHYCKAGMECIDAIKAVVSTITDPFEAYCTGNIIKYIWRWHDKNGVEDLNKAVQYIEFIKQHRSTVTIIETMSVEKAMGYLPDELTQEIREEMFTEDKPKGKYEGLSNEDVRMTFLCPEIACKDCPLYLPTGGAHGIDCSVWVEQNPVKARRIMLEWLKKDGKE